ncbi:unnamed protein product [Psylliodes chrysocephalus]|uniref:Uncharacterized protein n=1 Tax=Psylliodes chrysocephalus TaxID=3402493 RepID=A0A9P0CTZ3_9CUCU|nr:unnamed protein product [Psylliodes chrysocephala]
MGYFKDNGIGNASQPNNDFQGAPRPLELPPVPATTSREPLNSCCLLSKVFPSTVTRRFSCNDLQENEEFRIQITQVREEVKEQNKKLRAEIDKEGVNLRLEIGKDVKEKVSELKRNIEENLLGAIQIEVTKQTDMLNREIRHIKLQRQVHEEVIHNLKENVDKEIEKLNGTVEEQLISCIKSSEIGEINFRREIEEVKRKMQNTTEEILRMKESFRQNSRESLTVVPNYIYEGIKFDRNINNIHPEVFVTIVQNKLKNFRELVKKN